MNRKERIAEQLGMPQGTANHKLRKSIMFKYVCQAGENICYRCGNEIESVDDITIEHKLPWEGRDPELFWGLDNIAFSHAKCNRPHSFREREEAKHGTLWAYYRGCRCDVCKKEKSIDNAKRQR